MAGQPCSPGRLHLCLEVPALPWVQIQVFMGEIKPHFQFLLFNKHLKDKREAAGALGNS